MPHQNTVFHTILKWVPWNEFDRLVEAHGADEQARGFSTKSQFVAMLYGQLSGARSLREIEAGQKSHANRFYHLGVRPARRSTLAEANMDRPASVFSDLFAFLVSRLQRGRARRALAGANTYLIDSTALPLDSRSANWARFSSQVCGAKMHVIYDADAEQPIYAAFSTANINDITAAHAMPIQAGTTYVFDLGYYDYKWWSKLDAAGCRIVTRFKANTPLRDAVERPLPAGSVALSDRVGRLPKRQASNRSNPMHDPVREVRVKTDTGKILRILSNDLEASADELAALYKRRWTIELFFRWMKQTLRIIRFLGTSENAIRTQAAIALIAFLLLRLAQEAQTAITSALAFAQLVRANLMHARTLQALLDPEPPRIINPHQLTLALCKS
ncbi:MAG TPA: IS4 family transposase [Acidobacteriaceae bacterium]